MINYILKSSKGIIPLLEELPENLRKKFQYEIDYLKKSIEFIDKMIERSNKDYYGSTLEIGDKVYFGDSDDWDSTGKIIMFDDYKITALVECDDSGYENSPYWMTCNSLKSG